LPDIRLERQAGVAVLTIDRPQARNALAPGTMRELDALLAEVAGSDAALAVITGAGDRAFIAGGDLKELESRREQAWAKEMATSMRATLDRIALLPMPVMAAVNGAAVGGGAEVAVACDFRICADDARIGFTQVLLGLMPAWGGVERLAELVGRGQALYLLGSGRVLTGIEAATCGLVEESVPRQLFESHWRGLAEEIARAPAPVLRGIKAAVNGVRPGRHPQLAAPAVEAFSRAWADPRHWEMAAEMERTRKRG
jgi:enoyl-CoA hydratase